LNWVVQRNEKLKVFQSNKNTSLRNCGGFFICAHFCKFRSQITLMKFIFKSKKDTWLALLIWAIILLPLYLLFQDEGLALTALIVLSLSSLLCIWIWYGTYYTIEDKELKYQTGPFYGRLDIMSITKIHRTKSMMSSAALSMDRICIQYEKYNEILISPVRLEEFVRILKKINPNIVVEI